MIMNQLKSSGLEDQKCTFQSLCLVHSLVIQIPTEDEIAYQMAIPDWLQFVFVHTIVLNYQNYYSNWTAHQIFTKLQCLTYCNFLYYDTILLPTNLQLLMEYCYKYSLIPYNVAANIWIKSVLSSWYLDIAIIAVVY